MARQVARSGSAGPQTVIRTSSQAYSSARQYSPGPLSGAALGQAVAVLVSPSEYDSLLESRRRLAREDLQARLAEVRKNVAAAGLDVSVVDEAITAARSAE